MAGRKTLVNRTGHELRVTLIVRKGDHPEDSWGTVDVQLPAPAGSGAEAEPTRKVVTYGDAVSIYLNGIETTMISKGSAIGSRQTVVKRGSPLDDQLNTNDTIDFLYDGHQVLVSASNSTDRRFPFQVAPPDA